MMVEGSVVFSHTDEQGRARMVDVTAKRDTERVSVARGLVKMDPATLELIRKEGSPKGDVLQVARIAGLSGIKHTPMLIPLCHPLSITHAQVQLSFVEEGIEIEATVKSVGKTGVEMEALTGVSVAALTIYDMCKSVDKRMVLSDIRLIRKSGGKSGEITLE
ncbi:MAG: cyclic pyranopterin monophosphate synthase MoaC [Armatimonadetes bacterium]|nr:cyclic pyranopterin monophosphate synthase MoaC [Armatimonadota bacterium]